MMNVLPIDFQVIGAEAINLFWGPVLMWTVCAAAWLILARLLPSRYPQLRLDGAVGIMAALPLALVVAWVLPDSVGTLLPSVNMAASPETLAGGPTEVLSSSEPVISTLPWLSWIGLASLLMVLLPVAALGRLGWSWWQLRAIIRRARPTPDGSLSLRISEDVAVPFSAGLWRPVIVLPAGIATEDQEAIIRHEQAHIEHGDLWRTWLATTIRDLFAFHPLVHVLHRETALYAEICCDRRVLDSIPGAARSYARMLLQQAPFPTRLEPALPLISTPSQLKQRIEAMKKPTTLSLSRLHLMVWMGLLTFSVGLLAGCSDMEAGPTAPDIADVTNEAYELVMDLPAYKGAPGDDVFVVVEEAPILLGGLKELQSRIRYPELAKKAGVEGRVYLQFVVDQEGNVRDPQVTRGIGAGADEEALRALQTMKFVPGVQRGERVNVKMSLPVTFRLNGDDAPPPPPPPTVSKEQVDAVKVFDSMDDVDFEWVAVMSTKIKANAETPLDAFKVLAAQNGATAIVRGGSGFESLPDSDLREILTDPASVVLIRHKQ
jgi:TonB family protein